MKKYMLLILLFPMLSSCVAEVSMVAVLAVGAVATSASVGCTFFGCMMPRNWMPVPPIQIDPPRQPVRLQQDFVQPTHARIANAQVENAEEEMPLMVQSHIAIPQNAIT